MFICGLLHDVTHVAYCILLCEAREMKIRLFIIIFLTLISHSILQIQPRNLVYLISVLCWREGCLRLFSYVLDFILYYVEINV